jgi:hypothetical protein
MAFLSLISGHLTFTVGEEVPLPNGEEVSGDPGGAAEVSCDPYYGGIIIVTVFRTVQPHHNDSAGVTHCHP